MNDVGFFLVFLAICIVVIVIIFVAIKPTGVTNEPVQQRQDSTQDLYKAIANANRLVRVSEALIQAGLVGDKATVEAINNNTYKGPLPQEREDGGWMSIYDKLRILSIAGINHRTGIGKYIGRVKCTLVPEPTNQFDQNAIKVVSEDKHHLGYIPAYQTDFVRSFTGNMFPYRCTAFIEQKRDEDDGHKFFVGYVYLVKLRINNGQLSKRINNY